MAIVIKILFTLIIFWFVYYRISTGKGLHHKRENIGLMIIGTLCALSLPGYYAFTMLLTIPVFMAYKRALNQNANEALISHDF